MIVIKVELHSAITGRVKTLGQARIWNKGTGTMKRGNYGVGVHRKDDPNGPYLRTGDVDNYPRLSYSMWRLVIRALLACFPEERPKD